MVSWYPGDGNAIDVAGGNDGVLHGGAIFSLAGEVGQAFELNGTDAFVEAPDNPSLALSSQITIDAWIKPSALGGRIVDKVQAFGSDGWLLDTFGGKLRLIIDGHLLSGASTLPVGVFTHVTGTYDGVTMKVYVNGVLDGSAAVAVAIPTNTHPLRIGADQLGGSLFTGLIDEVEIFNRALSQSEINALVAAQIAGKCKVTDLAISKTHVGTFTVGTNGIYDITVSNVGTIRTLSPITVSDPLPSGMSFISTAPGTDSGWSCSGSTTVTCTNNGSIPAGSSSPVNLLVSVTTAGLRSNTATVSMFGDNNPANDQSTDTQTVNQAATATNLTVDVNPSVFGQTVTFTATVTATGITPTGSVQFFAGASPLGGPVALSGGVATLSISTLSVGSNSITAQFIANADFLGSTSNAINEVVNPANTTTTLVSSVNPSVFQQSVTFTATTSVVAPGGGALSNTVTFKDGATTLTTVPVGAGGVTMFTTSALSVGSHPITASYNGDGSHNGSLSNTVNQVVNKANTTLTLTSSANPGNPGGIVTFTATINVVAPGSGSPIAPTGTVTFKEGATVLGVRPVTGAGVATFSTALLSSGAHSIQAFYSGDGNFNSSTSNFVREILARADLALSQSTGQDPVMVGDVLHYEIRVASGGPNDAFNVVTTNATPPGTSFASISTDAGSMHNTGSRVHRIDNLPSWRFRSGRESSDRTRSVCRHDNHFDYHQRRPRDHGFG